MRTFPSDVLFTSQVLRKSVRLGDLRFDLQDPWRLLHRLVHGGKPSVTTPDPLVHCCRRGSRTRPLQSPTNHSAPSLRSSSFGQSDCFISVHLYLCRLSSSCTGAFRGRRIPHAQLFFRHPTVGAYKEAV